MLWGYIEEGLEAVRVDSLIDNNVSGVCNDVMRDAF